MHPPNCPDWEYDHHPNRQAVLKARTAELLVALRGGSSSSQFARDSRPAHLKLFQQLAPPGHWYYAGHYRGEPFRCLKYYTVGIPGDPIVGHSPSVVLTEMAELATVVAAGIAAADTVHQLPDVQVPKGEKLVNLVAFACRVFEAVLQVHPYANGNGHAARFILWALLGRYGYWPERFPIDPRPPFPGYVQLIVSYRNGDPEPLESFILSTCR